MENPLAVVLVSSVSESLPSSEILSVVLVHFAESRLSRAQHLLRCRRLGEALLARLHLLLVIAPKTLLAGLHLVLVVASEARSPSSQHIFSQTRGLLRIGFEQLRTTLLTIELSTKLLGSRLALVQLRFNIKRFLSRLHFLIHSSLGFRRDFRSNRRLNRDFRREGRFRRYLRRNGRFRLRRNGRLHLDGNGRSLLCSLGKTLNSHLLRERFLLQQDRLHCHFKRSKKLLGAAEVASWGASTAGTSSVLLEAAAAVAPSGCCSLNVVYRSISSFFVPDPESPSFLSSVRILEMGRDVMSVSDMGMICLTLLLPSKHLTCSHFPFSSHQSPLPHEDQTTPFTLFLSLLTPYIP